jgi:hypothetical protein
MLEPPSAVPPKPVAGAPLGMASVLTSLLELADGRALEVAAEVAGVAVELDVPLGDAVALGDAVPLGEAVALGEAVLAVGLGVPGTVRFVVVPPPPVRGAEVATAEG